MAKVKLTPDQLKEAVRQQMRVRLSMVLPAGRKFAFHCMEDFLNQYAGFFHPQPEALAKKDLRPQNQCFSNCQGIAHGMMDHLPPGGWTYAEGLAVRGSLGFPVHHGWLVDREGVVCDPTWRWDEDDSGEDFAYFGVPIRPAYLKRHIAACFKRGTWTAILDNWEANFPVLTGKHKVDQVVWPIGRFAKAAKPS